MSRITYDNAQKELKEILELIESQSIGIEELNKKLKRASELIAFCKKKLRDTETAVSTIVNTLESDG